jgi:hypothetical protein
MLYVVGSCDNFQQKKLFAFLVIFKARDYENANHLGQSIIMVG